MNFVHPVDPDIAAQFPGWEIERRSDGLLHAWLAGTDPRLVVTGEDTAALRDQIMSIALRAHGSGRRRRPPRWASIRWAPRSSQARITGSATSDTWPSKTKPDPGTDQITPLFAEQVGVDAGPLHRAAAIRSALPYGYPCQCRPALGYAIAWRRDRAAA